MNEVTPDNAASATPVAYRFRLIDEDGDKGEWRLLLPEDYDLLDAPFYEVEKLVPAATVAALEAEVEAWRSQCDGLNESRKEEASRADTAERRVAELTGLLSDAAGNLRRMANDEFAGCDQVRLEHVVNRIEDHLTGARAK